VEEVPNPQENSTVQDLQQLYSAQITLVLSSTHGYWRDYTTNKKE